MQLSYSNNFSPTIYSTTSSQVLPFGENLRGASFVYGPDHQRRKSVLSDTNGVIKTIIYKGDYEKIIIGGNSYEVSYISSPDGLVAMFVSPPSGGPGGALYYVHTDHLGSIISLFAANGSFVFEQNFDAWGRERNPDAWDYTANPNTKPQWLVRGFTGHEHHSPFGGAGGGLINMNGRMYDPLVGRMFSPDNFVQGADFTQTYNRYSYAMNNPLSFVDPDGQWVQAAMGLAFLLFTDAGYEIQKQTSPIAFHVDAHFSSEQRGVGIDVSVGLPKTAPLSVRGHVGASYYSRYYDGSYRGWETRSGIEASLFGAGGSFIHRVTSVLICLA